MTAKAILGKDNPLPEGVTAGEVSDGFHTFDELYHHRCMLMLALMGCYGLFSGSSGYDVGWSRRHDDGELCFGGGWVICWIHLPTGEQIRYHMKDTLPLPAWLEREVGTKWNGKDSGLDGLLTMIKETEKIIEM